MIVIDTKIKLHIRKKYCCLYCLGGIYLLIQSQKPSRLQKAKSAEEKSEKINVLIEPEVCKETKVCINRKE